MSEEYMLLKSTMSTAVRMPWEGGRRVPRVPLRGPPHGGQAGGGQIIVHSRGGRQVALSESYVYKGCQPPRYIKRQDAQRTIRAAAVDARMLHSVPAICVAWVACGGTPREE